MIKIHAFKHSCSKMLNKMYQGRRVIISLIKYVSIGFLLGASMVLGFMFLAQSFSYGVDEFLGRSGGYRFKGYPPASTAPTKPLVINPLLGIIESALLIIFLLIVIVKLLRSYELLKYLGID